jgi:hypothetical protein
MRDIFLPPMIHQAIGFGAEVWFSKSGGKDGQAMLEAYTYLLSRHEWLLEASRTTVVHADLKTAEWPQLKPHMQHLSAHAGLPSTSSRYLTSILTDAENYSTIRADSSF